MPYVTCVSLTEEDQHFLKENNISLSHLVRNRIRELRENP